MNTREELIEEAAKAIWDEDSDIPEHWDNKNVVEWEREEYRRMARAALAVFEKAHAPADDYPDAEGLAALRNPAPTDDERETLRIAELDARQAAYRKHRDDFYVDHESAPEIASNSFFDGWDAAVGTGFRRSKVPTPQGEPSDAQVEVAYQSWRQASVRDAVHTESPRDMERAWIRAALRAAAAVNPEKPEDIA